MKWNNLLFSLSAIDTMLYPALQKRPWTTKTFVTSSTRRSFFVSPGSRTHAPTEYPEEKSQAKRRRTLNSWHTVAENCHQPRKGEGAGAAIDESRFFSMPLIWIARILTPVLDHFSSIPIATKYSVCRIQARVTDLSRRQVTRFQHYIWANVALSSVHPSYHISPSVVHAATRGYRKLNRELDFIHSKPPWYWTAAQIELTHQFAICAANSPRHNSHAVYAARHNF